MALLVFTRALVGQAPASGQVSLTLSSASANLGASVSLNLNVASNPGNQPAGIQWTLAYPAGDAVLTGVAAGPALTAAGKSIYCNGLTGTITCLAVGLNTNPIGNGIAAVVTFSLGPSSASSTLSIPAGAMSAVLGNGTSIAAGGNGGAIAVAGWLPSVTGYFTDVAPTDSNYTAANLLYAAGISKGCTQDPLTFCPDRTLTRGEMATLLVRAVTGGDPASFNSIPYFNDVPPSHPFFAWIQKLFELDITSGCSVNPPLFCPDRPVSRGEISAFTIRGRYQTPTFAYPTTPYFTDVSPADPFFPSIQKMASLGMSGCSPGLFCSAAPATRGDTAAFLVRGLLNQLLPVGTPVLSAATPPAVLRGGLVATITVTGVNTHFADGSTLSAGPGITVSGLSVLNGQTLVANLSASSSATPGPRSLIVTTGAEEAVLPNGLTVQ